MSLFTPTRQPSEAISPAVTEVVQRKLRPVNLLALIGAVIVAFEVFVLIRWVSGPNFKHVGKGPTKVPTWMHYELIAWQVVSLPAALGIIYWFVIRPWRRERRIGIDGLLVIAFSTLWWQDPISNYLGPWVTYNADTVNFGSWVNSVPGALSQGSGGHMLVEPILFTPGAYVYIFTIVMFFGSWVMRGAARRWPAMGKAGLIGVCFAAMLVFDIVLEGIIWLPLGVFEYPGGSALSIFGNTYHKYPLNEMLTIGATFTTVAALRYFANDRGQSVAERGIDDVKGPSTSGRKFVLRAFATIAAVQMGMFAFYNLPNSWIGAHSTAWPKDLQKRSYLTNGICGDGTNIACPGPKVPLVRNGSVYIAPGGSVVAPNGVTVPKVVPFSR